ncbi:MAG: hypothetical protein L6R37_001899 [Teloschistes peruensis]|nr:MAG: hypothetical protein L6R37_001899 [Teloschistes peruensis]
MAGSGRGGRLDMASNGGVYLSNTYVQDNSAISQTAPPTGIGFGNPGTSQYPETPRRTHNLARQPEELHISSDGNAMNPQSSAHIPRHHSYHVFQDAGAAPGISVHQATPQGTHHTSALSAGTLPGALRPGVSSANTAPGSVPTLPQISTQTQHANPYSADANSSFSTNSNYMAPWPVYAFDWCKWPVQSQNSGDAAGKMAIGSFVEDGHNFIQILDTHATLEEDDMSDDAPQYGLEFVKTAEATHSYPVTRILWEPASSQKQSTDLLATSGDHLRLWSLPSQSAYNHSNSISRSSTGSQLAPQKLTPLALLSNSKSPEHTAPLTSLDWNNVSPSLIITSSIDTTCTIWDIPTLTAKTQLIAHDKEVFDVRFCANSVDVFVSCGADGSVRMFDLRSLEHSTIIYEPSEKNDKSSSSEGNLSPTLAQQTMSYAPPLLRLAASPHDAHLLATFSQDSNSIRILDVRQPGQALLELKGHSAAINCIEWSPSRRGTLASGGDDSLVLIWDLLSQGSLGTVNGAHGQQITSAATPSERAPIASWMCDYEVGNISWAPQSGLQGQGNDWLGVSGGRGIWGVCM